MITLRRRAKNAAKTPTKREAAVLEYIKASEKVSLKELCRHFRTRREYMTNTLLNLYEKGFHDVAKVVI